MKNFFLVCLLVQVGLCVSAQEYYYYKNEKVQIEKVTDKKYVVLDNLKGTADFTKILKQLPGDVTRFETMSFSGIINSYQGIEIDNMSWAIVEKEGIAKSTLQLPEVLYESAFYKPENGEAAGLSNFFYVKLKNKSDVAKLEMLAIQNGVQIIGNNNFMPLWYTLSCSKKSTGNALEMANLFYETYDFSAAEPDWMVDYKELCNNDSFFNNQWGLKNTGQNGGTSGVDIKACQAWTKTQGSDNVVVAVLDHGIESDHPDLTNMHPYSYDTFSGTSPSTVHGNHGTACAGIIGAESNNSAGVSGISPNCKLMSISDRLVVAPLASEQLASGISYAWENGASVISNSWGHSSLMSSMLDDAISDALSFGRNGLGTVVVFATGNHDGAVIYPANSNPGIIAVGAMSPCGERKSFSSCDGENWGSCYGTPLDIVAPGVLIPTTDLQGTSGYSSGDYTQTFNGTSSATPHVAGVAALILSVNSGLTQQQVANIIESTATKVGSYSYSTTGGRPNGTWHTEMGYGLLNADDAVTQAQALCSGPRDLYSRDWFNDLGFEPNNHTGVPTDYTTSELWASRDVWMRNQPDGITNNQHQNAEYSPMNLPAQLNYIYVRIGNRGCTASSGNEQVRVHWAKASIGSMTWPDNWDGTKYLDSPNNNALAGDVIGTATIPVIQPGESVIVQLPMGWNPPNPDNYDGMSNEPWHFCMVSQILDASDPSTAYSGIGQFTKQNNNVVWKNFSVVNNIANSPGAPCEKLSENIAVAVAAYSDSDIPTLHNIRYEVPMEDRANAITDEGDIIVKFDEKLYLNWVAGGKQGHGFEEISNKPGLVENVLRNTIVYDLLFPEEDKLFKISGTSVSFDNIRFDPNEVYISSVMALYPTTPVTKKTNFKLSVKQVDALTGEATGGVLYDLDKPDCNSNAVSAGVDQTVDRGCEVLLEASMNIPCAAYYWIDEYGNIISETATARTTVLRTTDYTLTVVSSGGCISTDEVTVNVSSDLCSITEEPKCFSKVAISPNPSSDGQLNISITSDRPEEAHISISDLISGQSIYESVEFVTGISPKEIPIHLENYRKGLYNVAIGCKYGEKVNHKIYLQ